MITDREERKQGIGMTSARTRERLVQRLAASGITSEAVLERIRAVPRHLFIDEALASRAYEDSALPIGQGQTISQPYIVALMTQALIENGETRRPEKVLEVGTGCGYQTAVLSPLVGQLFTIERIASLQRVPRQRTDRARLRQRPLSPRGRLRGLARPGALRRHPGGGRSRRGAAGPRRAARAGRAAGHPGRARRQPGTRAHHARGRRESSASTCAG